MDAITDFADQALLLPTACLVGIAMLIGGWLRGAIAWALVIGGMLVLMLVLKLLAGTCEPTLFGDQLQSPSGHTASAAAIYGGGLSLLLRRTLPRVPVALVCASVVALLVGLTRVLIGAHSVAEVAVGAVVGVSAAMILAKTAGPVPQRLRLLPIAALALAALLVLHGFHLPAEAAIRKVRLTWLPFGLCRLPG